jgi:hypothetical protein
MSAREIKTFACYQGRPDDRVTFSETDYALTVTRLPAGEVWQPGYDSDLGEVYTLSYPTSAAIDVIGRKLNAYAKSAIYTNPASGNRIFGKQIVFGQRYFLSLAHWYTNKPTNPAAWQGQPLLNWQRGVVDGRKYGIPGQVDYNEWQTALPWPNQPEPPPPPDDDEIECKVTTRKGNETRVYVGVLKLKHASSFGGTISLQSKEVQR